MLMADAGNHSAEEGEAARMMQICNACRYCEGYCAVFPAMTRRLSFDPASIHYLANLCHSCGACLHACQYAPPHEFAVNVPRALAKVRLKTYEQYAWPASLSTLYRRNGLALGLGTALGITLFMLSVLAMRGTLWVTEPHGNFYAIFPHNTLVSIFGTAFLLAVVALGMGVARFWRDQAPGDIQAVSLGEAVKNSLTLRYLDGGHGDGCNEEDDRFTPVRRVFHHLTFYGFAACFAATVTATIYHYGFGWHAPYSISSIPVLFGLVGGVGLLAGPAGLLWLNYHRHRLHGDVQQRPMDRAFAGLLFVTSLSGLAVLGWRATSAMPLLLAAHLGCVLALFLTLPYGKFAHAVYRPAALLKWAIERRQPSQIKLAAD